MTSTPQRHVFAPETWTRSAHRKLISLGYLVIYVVAVAVVLTLLNVVSPIAAIFAGLLYIASHVLRAMRLAALSVDLLGTSARTTAALHFATAPFALLLPLKTGELIRLYALWKLSGNAVYSVIVLLIDRMFDSLFLFPILIMLTLLGGAPTTLSILTLLVATIPLTVVVVGPRLLAEIQRYVVASKSNPVTLETLDKIDAARRLITHAAQVSRRQAPQLCVVSFMIWLCELLVCVILVNGAVNVLGGSLELLGARLVTFWASGAGDPLVSAALTITLIAQLAVWPAMVLIFLERRKHEPQSATADMRAKREVTP